MSERPSRKCPETLQNQIAQAPSDTVFLLLRVSVVGQAQRAMIENAGFVVRHQTTLVPCYAVSGPGAALQALLMEPWLVSVEPDGPVQTF
jgi:hypothetical protein